MRKLFNWGKSFCPKVLLCYYYRYKKIRYQNKIKEKRYSWGIDNPDKIFYIIGIDYKMAGIFAITKSVLSHIAYAIDKDYIPVIDMKHYASQFKPLTKGNPWELFFKQPMGWNLDMIAHSKNIICSANIQVPTSEYECSINYLTNPVSQELNLLQEIYRKYFHFSDSVSEYIQQEYSNLIGKKRNVVGVLCRGTDYTTKRPKYHPVQPSPSMVFEKLEEMKSTHPYSWIYIATEDDNILQQFKAKFGSRLIYNNQRRFEDIQNVTYISEIKMNNADRLLFNKQYLASLYILSRCDYLIGGRTSGTIGAYLMSEGFKYTYLWNLGLYE